MTGFVQISGGTKDALFRVTAAVGRGPLNSFFFQMVTVADYEIAALKLEYSCSWFLTV